MVVGYIVVFVLSFLIYIVFVGSISAYDVLTGIVVSLFVSLITTRYLVSNPSKLANPRRLAYLIAYLVSFTIMEIRCHLDVIKRIITGKTAPGIVRVPYELSSNYAVTLTACSITNTPGTVVVDIDEKAFYVHWIDVKTTRTDEIRREVSSVYEEYARKIFD